MKIGILGFGREGQAVLAFLKKDPLYKKAEFVVLDKNTDTKVPRGVELQAGANYLKNLSAFDMLFRTPGLPYLTPELQQTKKKGVVISSLTKLFFERCRATVIGVTGTKGKGTTATLLYKILKAAKKDVYLAGNIGVPAITILPKLKKSSIVVLELSSFQLQDLTVSPHIAVLLDVFPDHQDAHASLKEYYDAKSSIARYQTSKDTVFFVNDNSETGRLAKLGKGKKIAVSEKGFSMFTPSDIAMPGTHNFKNAVVAARVAESLKIAPTVIKKIVSSFSGNEHRLEFVKEISGIHFYNDSASTTPESLAAAIAAFPNSAVAVIAGGKDKNLDYLPVLELFQRESVNNIKMLVLFGENKTKIRQALQEAVVPTEYASDLSRALAIAYKTLKPLAVQGKPCVVVLSPGATSFDMFANYAERGTAFKKEVGKLTK